MPSFSYAHVQLNCSRCGAAFEGPPQRQQCYACSDAGKAKVRETRKTKVRTERAAARGQFTCETCGEAFTPTRATARFCSPRCRMAAHRNPAHQAPDPA